LRLVFETVIESSAPSLEAGRHSGWGRFSHGRILT